MPSLWEGFGLSAIEAMNACLSCLFSNVPGLKDLIDKDGNEAFLINPLDHDMIAEKLKLLIKNGDLRDEIGKKAFTQSFKFSSNRMVKLYLNLYKK